MNLDEVQMEIRPRLLWEASDLGTALGRRYALDLAKYRLVLMLPFLALCVYFVFVAPAWSSVLLWWLKPMFSVMPIFTLSRKLFGVNPRASECWRALGRWLRYHAWWDLSLGRFLLRRGMRQVVQVLEGKTTPKRYRLFRDACPRWLIKGCLAVETSLFIGLICSFYALVPESWKPWQDALGGWDGLFYLTQSELTRTLPEVRTLYAVLLLAYAFASMVSELLYVCSCFGCYLNTRTELEGWDVELAFKRMSSRLANLAKNGSATISCLVLIAVFGALLHGTAVAKDDSSISKQTAQKVLEHQDFKIHRSTTQEWRPEPKESRREYSEIQGLVELLGYTCLVVVVAGAAYFIFFLICRTSRPDIKFVASFSQVQVVAGLSVRPETLPADALASAMSLWAAGEKREAMSLLYRAALAWQIYQRGVRIEDADTEGDCTRKVSAAGEEKHYNANFFKRLTRAWLAVAYAEEFPSEGSWRSLCEQWPFASDPKTHKNPGNPMQIHALLLLGFCMLLSSCGKRVDVEKTEGYRGLARYQPFLAAERFLSERGIEAESSYSMLGAIQKSASYNVWLIQPDQLTTITTAQALHHHISENGGHAIIALSNLWAQEETGWAPDRDVATESVEKIADDLRIKRDREMERQAGDTDKFYKKFKKTLKDTQSPPNKKEPESEPESDRREEIFAGSKLMTRLKTSSPGLSWILEELDLSLAEKMDESEALWKKHNYGEIDWAWPTALTRTSDTAPAKRILTQRVGAGSITFLPSLRPFTNLRLGQAEHALLLERLVSDRRGQSKVCFVRGSGVSFWALLFEYGWRVIAALAVALVLWIWSVTKGFAPATAGVLISPASAFTNLQATGEFLFRHRQWDALLKPWRERLLLHWMRLQAEHAPETEDAAIIGMAEDCGLTADELRECYSPPKNVSPTLFLTIVRRLYRLETKL